MPDRRRHRGAHPEDSCLFSAERLKDLRNAVADYSFLLGRDYPESAALELVGNRFELTARQRTAVWRSACSDAARIAREARRVPLESVRGRTLAIDGYNLLITIESALSGGVLLRGRDGPIRDLASIHGTYRSVEETRPAIQLAGMFLADHEVLAARWLLDAPISNSGRLAARLQDEAEKAGWSWEVAVVPDPDRELVATRAIVVSSDRQILDGCANWVDLAGPLIRELVPHAWIVDLALEE